MVSKKNLALLLLLILAISLLTACSGSSSSSSSPDENKAKLTLEINNGGEVIVSGNGTETINTGAGTYAQKYKEGTTIELQAVDTSYVFSNWNGTDQNTSKTITLNNNKSITANFSLPSGIAANNYDELTNYLNESYETIVLESDITVADSQLIVDKLITLDLEGHSIIGDVEINTTANGEIILKNGTITGNLTVDAPNATVTSSINIEGTTEILNVAANSFNNQGSLNAVTVSDSDGCSFNNQPGSKIKNLTVEGTNVQVENDGSSIDDINVTGSGIKVKNKNKTKIKNIEVNNQSDNTEIDNTDSEIDNVNIKGRNTKVQNKTGTKVGNINVDNEGSEVNNNDGTTVDNININSDSAKVNNEQGAKITNKISVSEKATNANIENSGDIENLDVDETVKDSTKVTSSKDGTINQATGAEVTVLVMDNLKLTVKKGSTLELPATMTAKVIGTTSTKEVSITWNKIYKADTGWNKFGMGSDWTAGTTVDTSKLKAGNKIFKGTADGKTVSFKLRIKDEINSGIELNDGPDKVASLNLILNSENNLYLTWGQVDTAVRYFIYRNTEDNIDTAQRIATDITTTSFEDTANLEEDTKYYYWVEAYNQNGLASPISNSITNLN